MCGLPGLPTWQPRSFTPEIPFEPYIDMKRQGIFFRALYVCRQVLGGGWFVVVAVTSKSSSSTPSRTAQVLSQGLWQPELYLGSNLG